jgi:hypothetical protein
MRYAIIENGKVVNIATADKPLGKNWVKSNGAKIGDLYDGDKFTTPEKETVVPTITRFQFKKAVIDMNKFTEFSTFLTNSSDEIKVYFQDKEVLSISDSEIQTAKTELGYSDQQLANLFISASEL